jgi:hypothetical protein
MSLYEEDKSTGTVFNKLLKALNLSHTVDQDYADIINGKNTVTEGGVGNLIEGQAYLLLFNLYFGEKDERYINFKENVYKY